MWKQNVSTIVSVTNAFGGKCISETKVVPMAHIRPPQKIVIFTIMQYPRLKF